MARRANERVRKTHREKRAAARVVTQVERPVTLEEVLVSFQKSLARASQSAEQASRADPGFALGQSQLYTVSNLKISLNVGVRPATSQALGSDRDADRMVLDFNEEDPDKLSTIDFEVRADPLELETGTRLLIADGDPLGEKRPDTVVRLTALKTLDTGQTLPDKNLKVSLRIVGELGDAANPIDLTTGADGTLSITIDPDENTVMGLGIKEKITDLDLSREHGFYVFATAEGYEPTETLAFSITESDS